MQTLLRTPLYDRHVALGARLVPFAGWEMPVQYEGVIPEHRAVRSDAGAFDVSHMGELTVEGPGAREFLQSVLSNDVERLEPGPRPVHAPDERAGRDRRRPDRLRARARAVPADRERLEPRARPRLAAGARAGGRRGARRLGRLRADRRPGAALARAARAARRAGVHLRRGRGRRRRVHRQPDGLHGRGRESSCSSPPTRPRSSGTASSSAGSSPAGSARATRCGSRSATRCTGTTSRPRPTRSRPASAGSARSTPASPAPMSCGGSRRPAPSASWSRS